METKEEILKNIIYCRDRDDYGFELDSLGLPAKYYDEYYLIGRCFTLDELSIMSEEELNNLVVLAQYALDVLF